MSRGHESERSRLYWVPPALFVLSLLVAITGLTFVIKGRFHTAGFITAGIMASIGFHLFSLGNTAYASAASLENEELAEYGYHINQNGIYATFGAGGVFLSSALWFLFQEIENTQTSAWYALWVDITGLPVELIEMIQFAILRSTLAAGILIFSIGFLNQSRYGDWFTIVLEEIDASHRKETVIDQVLDELSNFGVGSSETVTKEKTIEIANPEPAQFSVVRVETPKRIEPGEKYAVRARVANRGSEDGRRRIVCYRDDKRVDTTETTLSSGAEKTLEFTDTAPTEEKSCTVRIEIEA